MRELISLPAMRRPCGLICPQLFVSPRLTSASAMGKLCVGTSGTYHFLMDEHENELSKLVDQLNRAATAVKTGEKRSIDQLLATAVQNHASDIILVAGSPATLRVNGELIADSGQV